MVETLSTIAAVFAAVQTAALIMHCTSYPPVTTRFVTQSATTVWARVRAWFWLQAVAGGVACLAVGIALDRLHPFSPTQVVVALIVTAVARFFIPFFATDQGDSRFQTLHGAIHMVLAVLAFGGLLWAATGFVGNTQSITPTGMEPKAS